MAKAYLYDLTDTWNAGATTFTALKMNVTDTASSASSLLMNLQVGGNSKFTVSKEGATKVTPVAVASLPAAATVGAGARAFVNDASAPVFGSAVVGGGAVSVPVYSTGSAWHVG